MKFLRLNTTDPYYNLAVEEYLFCHESDDVFMLWQNEPTVVIGKNQNAYAEVNMDYVERNGIHIARRLTGGGAVYHDHGNLNYTFISAKNSDTSINFARFTAPIIEALASVGVHAMLSGRNDLTVDEKKISGNAQHSANGKTLHHGTLLFESDLDVLSYALHVDEEKLRARAIRSTRSRVTNLKPLMPQIADVNVFSSLISHYVMQKYAPLEIEPPMNAEIEALRARNASHEWIFPERELVSHYSVIRKQRYPFGGVEISLDMCNDIIRDIRIRGDFFSLLPIEELESLLQGKSMDVVEKTLISVDVDSYICGMTCEMLTAQLRSE